MKQIFTFCILITAVFCIYQPLNAGERSHPFIKISALFSQPHTISFSASSKLISFKASRIHNKILLQWVMRENETTDQFEIEKSTDGKNFILTAIIFGTDKPEIDSYEFYDNVKKEKIFYRLKIIGKNKQVTYSDILVIEIK